MSELRDAYMTFVADKSPKNFEELYRQMEENNYVGLGTVRNVSNIWLMQALRAIGGTRASDFEYFISELQTWIYQIAMKYAKPTITTKEGEEKPIETDGDVALAIRSIIRIAIAVLIRQEVKEYQHRLKESQLKRLATAMDLKDKKEESDILNYIIGHQEEKRKKRLGTERRREKLPSLIELAVNQLKNESQELEYQLEEDKEPEREELTVNDLIEKIKSYVHSEEYRGKGKSVVFSKTTAPTQRRLEAIKNYMIGVIKEVIGDTSRKLSDITDDEQKKIKYAFGGQRIEDGIKKIEGVGSNIYNTYHIRDGILELFKHLFKNPIEWDD